MWLFLPTKDFAIDELLQALSNTSIKEIDRAKRVMNVHLKMPKFKLTWGTKELSSALQALGLHDIFDPNKADFSLMGKSMGENLFLSGLYHKAYIEVDERGSEAAAATTAVVGITATPIDQLPTFYCDKPFVFMIVKNDTLSPLFIGVVQRP